MRATVVCVAGRRVLDVLRDMGARTVLLDSDIPLDVALAVDIPVEVDLDDWESVERALLRVAAGTPVDAVLSVRDSYVPLAGYLAARLGVRGLALHAALNCHDKARMRRALDGAGVGNPRYRVVEDPSEAMESAREVGFPLVVKRVRGAGGAGVRLCRDASEVDAAVAQLVDPAEAVPLLVEQYLEGVEYAIQTVTVNGVTEVLAVLAETVGPAPRFAETGYDHPTGLGEGQLDELRRFTSDALAALGFDHGIAHVQVRRTADGPRVIEVNPRPPGGAITEVTEALSGVNLLRAAVEATLGTPISRRPATATHVRYRCVVFDERGQVDFDPSALEDLPAGPAGVPPPLVSLDIEPGEEVFPVDHPDGGVYGRIVVFGTDSQSLIAQENAIAARLGLHIRPTARAVAAVGDPT